MILKNKNIVLGVCGSISAYKSPLLLRELIKEGANVNVIMTESAKEFVAPKVLSNLSRNPVIIDMFDDSNQSDGSWHISLAHKSDLMIIAPSSATTLGKLANGICDNALIALAIAMPKNVPILIAPAMDTTMWESNAVQRNIEILKRDGFYIIEPEIGELASGIFGKGRLPETTTLLDEIKNILKKKVNTNLLGKKVLITAGPTIEKIDDVRFISNHSSGKMGYSLAIAAQEMGAEVTLISGPVNLTKPDNINLINVQTAQEMFDEVMKVQLANDILIMCAAVSDFTLKDTFNGKIKKGKDENFVLNLERTNDILAELGKIKTQNQTLIGFALESENEIENANKKLVSKNCDYLILNSANKVDSGFGGDKNTVSILSKSNPIKNLPTMLKNELAYEILNEITFKE